MIRFDGKFFCTFREGERHVRGRDGQIRIITSDDGKEWHSAALLAEEGVDLRDPKLSITPDGRECAAGEEVQVDFGTGAPILTPDGKRRKTWVFRVVLTQ